MDVEQKQVRLQAGNLPGRFGGGARTAEKLIIAFAQQHLECGAYHRMVVNKQYARHAVAPARGRLMRTLVDPGAETNRIEPWARSTRSLRDQGSAALSPFTFGKPVPLSATLSCSR